MPSEERNYYVICDDNCKFPSMTYEQILEAIAEATGNVPEHVEDAFITKIKESNHNANLTFWKGTQAEFNALGVTAHIFKIGIDGNGKLYFTPFEADDLTAHASRHASGGEDELTAEDIGALPDYGGTMGGNIDMDGNKVTGLPTPTSNSDAVPKQYVDDKEITFFVGDGAQASGEIITHDKNYKFNDITGLSIPCEKYMVTIDGLGFGSVGAAGLSALDFYFVFDDDTDFHFSISNGKALDNIDKTHWNVFKRDIFWGENATQSVQQQWYGSEFTGSGAGVYGTGYSDRTIKRVYVRAANDGVAFMCGMIRFIKIAD